MSSTVLLSRSAQAAGHLDARFDLLRRFCGAVAVGVVALGCFVLFGWAFRIAVLMSVIPGLATMKANTALCLVLFGISLWLLLPGESRGTRGRIARGLALATALFGVATLAEYLFGAELGIDELLVEDPLGSLGTSAHGRMAPTTATAFLALGLALILLDRKTRRGRSVAQPLSLVGGLIAMMAINGYIYRATVDYKLFPYTQVAVHTAIALGILSTAVFLARPRIGIAGDLTGDGSGSVMARRMLPAIFWIPILLGWICLEGQRAGLYGREPAMALLTTANIALFALVLWWSARLTNREHGYRSRAEVDLRDLNAKLEERVAERTQSLRVLSERLSLATAVARVGVWERDMVSGAVTFDATMFDIYGLTPAGPITYEEFAKSLHPEDVPAIEASVQRAVEDKDQSSSLEFRIVRPDGCVRNIDASLRAMFDEQGSVSRLIGVNMDVTERKRAEKALQESEARMTHSAEHDSLTGLPNRTLLNDRLGQAIALARRRTKLVALLFLDLDGFKHINDSLGHSVGDRLLQSVAGRLLECVRTSDTVSRQGGDEFVVLLTEVERPDDAAVSARRMIEAVELPHVIDQYELHVTTSIGVSVYPDDGRDAETLVKNADTAMYQAKENGRQGFQFFEPAMNVRAVERQSVEGSLRRALERHEFTLHYQPMIDLKTGTINGAEALIRWMHPTRGLVPPAQFIPIAEDCGLILPIGNWVLREACRQARTWIDAGLFVGSMKVNISAVEFRAKNFLEGILAILAETGLDPTRLELELTESVLMRHAESAEATLEVLRAKGVRLAVDDFGTGYSSLSYLRKFQVDVLKIDQSFIRQITQVPEETRIVAAVISMGRNLGLRVVAEGVETEGELAFLQAHDCDEAQGYYFSRPVPPEQFAGLLRTGIPEPLPALAGT